jgi:hypothetical protein
MTASSSDRIRQLNACGEQQHAVQHSASAQANCGDEHEGEREIARARG